MRKLLFSTLLLGSLAATAMAGTYRPMPQAAAQTKPVITYQCNWPSLPSVVHARQSLTKNYHVKSYAYPYVLRLVFPDNLLFAPMTNKLTHQGAEALGVLAGLVASLPGATIKVIGYTNNIDSPKLAKQQSLLKSQKVAGFLWESDLPLKSQRADYIGAGAKNFLQPNNSVQGLQANQRVEVLILLPH